MLQFMLMIVLLFLPIFVESKGNWSYENIKVWLRDPDNHYCRGKVQSPIDLQFGISLHDRRLQYLYLEKRSAATNPLELVNNGHTAQINFENHYVLKNVAPKSEDYRVAQMHFHWGHSNNTNIGSEHLLNGQPYPLEMHIVTYSSWFSNLSQAMSNTRALAVVGVFFEVGNENNSYLQPLVDALKHIQHKDSHTLVSDFNLKELIGEKRMHRYYRYDGSLTTPPCYESVIWSVLEKPLQLSSDQLHAFQSLHGKESKVMKNTYRPIQPIGTRKLFRSFRSNTTLDDKPMKESHGQCLSVNMKIFFILISLLMIMI